jgi:hypothetical protein
MEGGRRGPRRGLMCPDLSAETCHANVWGSALTKPMSSYAGPSAMVNTTTEVSGDMAVPRRLLTRHRDTDHVKVPSLFLAN